MTTAFLFYGEGTPFLFVKNYIMWNAWAFALQPQYVLNGASATGVGTTIKTKWFKHVIIELSSASSANFTVKFQGAMGTGNLWNTAPDFSSAKSATNPWDYFEVIDTQDGAAIDGDTWVAFAGTDDVRYFILNTDRADFFNAEITAYSAGTVNVRVRLYTND